jgi:hypothetical protein
VEGGANGRGAIFVVGAYGRYSGGSTGGWGAPAPLMT